MGSYLSSAPTPPMPLLRLLSSRHWASVLFFSVLSLSGFAAETSGNVLSSLSWKNKEGAPAVSVSGDGREKITSFLCDFSNHSTVRCYWDLSTSLDLSNSEGIQFQIRADKLDSIGSFTFYFKAGKGWYSQTFSISRRKVWETVTILKTGAKTEGEPGGWNKVDGLRLAAWRAQEADGSFELRHLHPLGVLGEDTSILVLQNSTAKEEYAANISKYLSASGLRHALLPESSLDAATLAQTKLLILPYHSTLPPATISAIDHYLQDGGKLLAFYSLPAELADTTGIKLGKHLRPTTPGVFSSLHTSAELNGAPPQVAQHSWNIITASPASASTKILAEWFDASGHPSGQPAILGSANTIFMTHVLLTDDSANQQKLLLALAGRLLPSLWSDLLARRRSEVDRMGIYETYESAVAALGQTPADTEAHRRLDASLTLRTQAALDEKAGRFVEAIDATDRANRLLLESYCLAQPSQEGEFRAFWCHNAYGIKGKTWDESIRSLKAHGFNAIFPNMLWGGAAFYPSDVLPLAQSMTGKPDQIAECLAACRKYGVQIHVWKVDWNLGHDFPKSFLEKMRQEGRLQMSDTGEEEPWLCPSHPLNAALERDALVEVAKKYAVDGIHFDYIRYPDTKHCFCPHCRERFEQATGKAVAQWPKDVMPNGTRREEWIPWCQGNITKVVRTTSEAARLVRPGIKVSAAVFRNWDLDSRAIMQDWKLWCEKGYLDFVCPMDYSESDVMYESWVKQQKLYAGKAGLIPGIGVSSSHSTLRADAVINQIQITRKYGTQGFILFNYGEKEEHETLPLLGLGPTKPVSK